MVLSLTLQSGSKEDVTVKFDPPLAGYEDVKPRLLEMKSLAQEGLGMVRIALTLFPVIEPDTAQDKNSPTAILHLPPERLPSIQRRRFGSSLRSVSRIPHAPEHICLCGLKISVSRRQSVHNQGILRPRLLSPDSTLSREGYTVLCHVHLLWSYRRSSLCGEFVQEAHQLLHRGKHTSS